MSPESERFPDLEMDPQRGASSRNFPPVRLAFAWTRSDEVPILLGQVNFFMEFDVCFFRAESAFEVRPRRDRIDR